MSRRRISARTWHDGPVAASAPLSPPRNVIDGGRPMQKQGGLRFKKTGREIKAAVSKRIEQLQQRLDRRGRALDDFLADRALVRSYLVRAIGGRVRYRNPEEAAPLYPESDISSEQMEEVRKVCERIFELEHELRRLRLVIAHLADDEVFELGFAQLAAYGFEP